MKYLMIIAAALALMAPVNAQAADTARNQIKAIQRMEDDTLARLYKEKPDTRAEIKDAVGYAVFSTGELAVVWLSAGYGHGIAHSNTDGANTYMKMARAGIGLGLGAKDYNTVFVFHDRDAFNSFINTGLDLSGTADAAVKAGNSGGAVSGGADVLAGVRVYQLTNSGLLAQAMLQGTKYWRDDELNNATLSSAQ